MRPWQGLRRRRGRRPGDPPGRALVHGRHRRELLDEQPGAELFIVIVGGDAAAGLRTWERADELAELVTSWSSCTGPASACRGPPPGFRWRRWRCPRSTSRARTSGLGSPPAGPSTCWCRRPLPPGSPGTASILAIDDARAACPCRAARRRRRRAPGGPARRVRAGRRATVHERRNRAERPRAERGNGTLERRCGPALAALARSRPRRPTPRGPGAVARRRRDRPTAREAAPRPGPGAGCRYGAAAGGVDAADGC